MKQNHYFPRRRRVAYIDFFCHPQAKVGASERRILLIRRVGKESDRQRAQGPFMRRVYIFLLCSFEIAVQFQNNRAGYTTLARTEAGMREHGTFHTPIGTLLKNPTNVK